MIRLGRPKLEWAEGSVGWAEGSGWSGCRRREEREGSVGGVDVEDGRREREIDGEGGERLTERERD